MFSALKLGEGGYWAPFASSFARSLTQGSECSFFSKMMCRDRGYQGCHLPECKNALLAREGMASRKALCSSQALKNSKARGGGLKKKKLFSDSKIFKQPRPQDQGNVQKDRTDFKGTGMCVCVCVCVAASLMETVSYLLISLLSQTGHWDGHGNGHTESFRRHTAHSVLPFQFFDWAAKGRSFEYPLAVTTVHEVWPCELTDA